MSIAAVLALPLCLVFLRVIIMVGNFSPALLMLVVVGLALGWVWCWREFNRLGEPSEAAPIDWSGVDTVLPAAREDLRRIVRALNSQAALPIPYGMHDGKLLQGCLAKAPHVLVAGATGSGKSVWLDTMIRSLAAARDARRWRLVIIDPKRVELTRFASLPHTAAVATEKPESRRVLAALCDEMDRRYQVLQAAGKRNVSETDMQRIVVAIDEFADLILPHNNTKEERDVSERLRGFLARLLALGRAAGIHVVLATQRPDAKVVDGLMKANVPTRVAFRTASALESRIILDSKGAETLAGRGDGLVRTGDGRMLRFQGIMLEG